MSGAMKFGRSFAPQVTCGEMAPIPRQMRSRPRDPRGFPVPWFVRDDTSPQPDFTILSVAKWHEAIQCGLCWLCGGTLGRTVAFVLGPINVVTRTTTEAPAHPACAEYAVQICPFLTD